MPQSHLLLPINGVHSIANNMMYPAVQSCKTSLARCACTKASHLSMLTPCYYSFVCRAATEKFAEAFKSDGTTNLITRLQYNVIRTGLRRINLAYSRISLKVGAMEL